jgi:hypothetical protein
VVGPLLFVCNRRLPLRHRRRPVLPFCPEMQGGLGCKLWNIIFILLAIAGIIATWIVSQRFATRRRVTIFIANPVNLMRLPGGIQKLHASYEGHSIGSLWSVDVAVCNTGNQDIAAEDVRSAPRLALGDGVRVLDVDATSPQSAERAVALLENGDGRMVAHIAYLRPGKGCAFKLLLSEEHEHAFQANKIALDDGALIRDASCAVEHAASRSNMESLYDTVASMVQCGMGCTIGYWMAGHRPKGVPVSVTVPVAATLAIFCLGVLIAALGRRNRRGRDLGRYVA